MECWGSSIIVLGGCHGRVVVVGFNTLALGKRHGNARYWDGKGRVNVTKRRIEGEAAGLCCGARGNQRSDLAGGPTSPTSERLKSTPRVSDPR